jgi:hypothetical protein
MAERNFFGRLRATVANRIAPGSPYDERGNYLHNGGRAGIATALKVGANMFFPGAGVVVDKIMSPWVDRGANYGIGEPTREAVPIYGAPQSAQHAYAAAPPTTSNLGFGAQSPGGSWNGYLQSQGSVNNLGSQGFTRPGYTNWSPSSRWGQQLTEQPATQGSNLGFGNNVQGFAGGGGGSSSGSSMSGNRMAGIVGGRLASDSMIDLQRRWANR